VVAVAVAISRCRRRHGSAGASSTQACTDSQRSCRGPSWPPCTAPPRPLHAGAPEDLTLSEAEQQSIESFQADMKELDEIFEIIAQASWSRGGGGGSTLRP
jgi:hypothetical protein